MNVELTVKQDPRFTPEVIEAMEGPVDPGWTERKSGGENQIVLTKYLGSWADGAMDSMASYLNSDKQTHLWNFKGPDGEENIVALDHIAFPEDKRRKLEELGVQLDPSGFLDSMGAPPESAYSEPEPGHDTEGTQEADAVLEKDSSFTPDRIAAMKGKAYAGWVEGDNLPAIELTDYAGSQDHGEGRGKIHFWNYKNLGSEEEIRVALEYVKFPDEKREELEKLGIHLDEEGLLVGMDPVTEVRGAGESETSEPNPQPQPRPTIKRVSDDQNPKGRLAEPGGVQVPPEYLPESVTDDYKVYERPSGLLVAQSKAYNRFKKHKSEIEDMPNDRIDEVPSGGGEGEPPSGDSGNEETPEPRPQPKLQPQTQTEMQKEPPPPDEPPNHEREKRYRLEVGVANGLPVEGEDTILRNDGLELFGLFDGQGELGDNAASASAAAAEAIEEAYIARRGISPSNAFASAEDAQRALAQAKRKVAESGGHTTAAVVKIENIDGSPHLVWANAGGRIYIDRADGSSLAELSLPDQHDNPINTSELDDCGTAKLTGGDRIVLCTSGILGDGVTASMTPEEFGLAVNTGGTQASADRFVELSRVHKDKSVIVVDVRSA
jgi:hypothetical protein